MQRLILAALLPLTMFAAVNADDVDAPIAEMFKSGKLFEKAEYKNARQAAAKIFETKYADQIKSAFGEDRDAINSFLEKNKEWKEEFYAAIGPHDDMIRVLEIFRSLWKDNAAAVAKYPNLAIAISVVWDRPEQTYDYRGHQIRTKSHLPKDYMKHDAVAEWHYHIEHAQKLKGTEAANRLEVLPWEFLVYVVDHRTPVKEREWSIQNYLSKRQMIGKIYREIEYDKEMLRTKSEVCKLNDHDYTLSEIKKYGGVCAMQADFSARVGKSLAVPASYVRGPSQSLGLHAWVMWVEVKNASKSSVSFSLESEGRYFDDNYYFGTLVEPNTGQEITDRDMERRLSDAANNRNGKRQGEIAMQFYPALAESNKFDSKKRVQFLSSVLKLSIYNEAAWIELARLVKEKEITEESRPAVIGLTNQLTSAFTKYPDFTWKVGPELIAIQKDRVQRNQFIEALAKMYENGNRPDLACEARLKWADSLGEAEKWQLAAQGLSYSIKRFPSEGRYIPKMLNKLKDVGEKYKGGKDVVSQTYLELMRKIPPRRGTEVTEYFLKTAKDSLDYLRAEGKKKELAEVEKICLQAGVSPNSIN